MKVTATIFYALAAVLLLSTLCHSEERLLQSTSRTALVTRLCAQFSDRTTIVDEKAKA